GEHSVRAAKTSQNMSVLKPFEQSRRARSARPTTKGVWAKRPYIVSCRCLSLLPLLLSLLQSQADSVVTNCTQDALAAALATGGTVTFTQGCSLSLTNTLTIGGNVTIDAAGRSGSLLGNNTFRLITVQPSVTLTLKGLTLSRGQHTNGGALYINPGASVVLTNCILAGNHAAGFSGDAGNDGATNNPSNGGNGGNGTPGSPGYGGAIYNL